MRRQLSLQFYPSRKVDQPEWLIPLKTVPVRKVDTANVRHWKISAGRCEVVQVSVPSAENLIKNIFFV